MHPSRILTLAGTVLAGLGILLPQARFPVVGPVDGIDGASWPVLLPLGLQALMALMGPRREAHRLPAAVSACLLACAALVFALAKVVDAFAATGPLAEASVGAGAWTVAAGAGLAALGSLLGVGRRLG